MKFELDLNNADDSMFVFAALYYALSGHAVRSIAKVLARMKPQMNETMNQYIQEDIRDKLSEQTEDQRTAWEELLNTLRRRASWLRH